MCIFMVRQNTQKYTDTGYINPSKTEYKNLNWKPNKKTLLNNNSHNSCLSKLLSIFNKQQVIYMLIIMQLRNQQHE